MKYTSAAGCRFSLNLASSVNPSSFKWLRFLAQVTHVLEWCNAFLVNCKLFFFFFFEHLTQYDWWSQRTGCHHYYDEFCFILLLRVSCPSHTGFCIWDCGYPHTHHAHSHLSAEPVRALTHSLSFMHLWCPKHLWNNETSAKSQVHISLFLSRSSVIAD